MSRFGNLEFGDDLGARADQSGGLKDEHFYLREAVGQFHRAHFEESLRSYAKVLEFNPKHPEAWVGQVRMLIELGEYREASLWADKGLQLLPNEPDLLAAKAVALGRSGDLQGAISFSDAAIQERGDSTYVWLARADVLLARKEKRADYCFEKALGKAAHDWCTHWLAARIMHFYKQSVKALKLLQKALMLEAGQPALWLEIGRCQFDLGMAVQSRTSFQHALELDPGHSVIQEQLNAISSLSLLTRLRGAWRQFFTK